MKISTQPPQHLSNHEVLIHLLAQKADTDRLKSDLANHALRNKANMRQEYALKIEKEEAPDISGLPELNEEVRKREDEADRRGWADEVGWIQDEVIRYLCYDYNKTARQTSEGVAELADSLQNHGLTKSEVLQICNLAPSQQAELYTVIETAEARFETRDGELAERLASIQAQVAATLLPSPPDYILPYVTTLEHELAAPTSGAISPDAEERGEWQASQYTNGGGYSNGVTNEGDVRMEQEFVTEVEYGADYEAGADADVNEDMD